MRGPKDSWDFPKVRESKGLEEGEELGSWFGIQPDST